MHRKTIHPQTRDIYILLNTITLQLMQKLEVKTAIKEKILDFLHPLPNSPFDIC